MGAVFLWYTVTKNRLIQRVTRLGVPFLVHASRAAIQNVVFLKKDSDDGQSGQAVGGVVCVREVA